MNHLLYFFIVVHAGGSQAGGAGKPIGGGGFAGGGSQVGGGNGFRPGGSQIGGGGFVNPGSYGSYGSKSSGVGTSGTKRNMIEIIMSIECQSQKNPDFYNF